MDAKYFYIIGIVIVLSATGCAIPTIPREYQPYPSRAPVAELLEQARTAEQNNELELATALLERALFIESGDAMVWHQLAKLYAFQAEYKQAVGFAGRSNAYAADYPWLQKENFILMANAYEKLGQSSKARKAKSKAGEL